jgi:hypothetical protein
MGVLNRSEIFHVLTLSIDVPDHAAPTYVDLGLPGNGRQARAIVDSIRLTSS